MRSQTDVLRTQHEELRTAIERIGQHAVAADVGALAQALRALKVALLAHLELEDSHLYPELALAAAQAESAVPVGVADTYQHNMKGVSTSLKAFLDQYDASFRMDDFQRDWPLVARMLCHRMESEEATLYPLYDAWCSRQRLP
ncbi:MAG: hemerythrin domain-containing protein [Polyangia bacterium]